MNNETTFKNYVKRGMRGRWIQRSIETGGTGAGVPDSYFSMPGVSAWIEFKHHNSWPSRKNTIVKIKNHKKFIFQRNFIWQHGQNNGRMFFFIKIGEDYLLFDYKGTMKLSTLTKSGMYRYCIGYWKSRIDFSELAILLSKDYRKIPIGIER